LNSADIANRRLIIIGKIGYGVQTLVCQKIQLIAVNEYTGGAR
jgi:hypothetical protein